MTVMEQVNVSATSAWRRIAVRKGQRLQVHDYEEQLLKSLAYAHIFLSY